MNKNLINLLIIFNLNGIRDPFYFGQVKSKDNSKIICKGIGKLNEKRFAFICYKNKTESFKIGQKIDDKEIVYISDDFIIIKNKNGEQEKIFVE